MKLLILRTNINSERAVQESARLFNDFSGVINWNIDSDDREKVLRIEADDHVRIKDIAELIAPLGYACEDLDDEPGDRFKIHSLN